MTAQLTFVPTASAIAPGRFRPEILVISDGTLADTIFATDLARR
jgi:hypothetical protein